MTIKITQPGTVTISPSGDVTFDNFNADCGGVLTSERQFAEALTRYAIEKLEASLRDAPIVLSDVNVSPDPLIKEVQ
jgi:hypothetical protein